MNEDQALAAVEKSLKKRRFEHTLRVTEEAEILARRYNVDVKKTRLAAILHDYAKYRPVDEMKETVKQNGLSRSLLTYSDEILHAFVGAFYVEKELHVTDRQILSAIRYHTTGRANMTPIEKVVFLADYIEPGRTFNAVEIVRDMAKLDLDRACFFALKNIIQFIVSKDEAVYPETFEAYNDFALLLQRRI
ncbi:bis(5'-nucleosyl)-tetraphosphatase (symmetrical) YqeK [Evansella sp. AB-P1]|uniref:bis(5'-nucleosyl)-tetraphosphatase (symmetrical) YqeK n=1 Tax=Evansella sp. AB-P1 TaxID=3037653 RepID=UPI00241CDF03|nr:bis(5'-nucleosyl)-tetraphosphatase (symmetrical) YqeK [Evansella sp. AB-P1]MDG5786515.1 bis(5'-nucleosyl)-tetraphosphatase (symmetrical) YqeK [Evansella sp. AB-P1]